MIQRIQTLYFLGAFISSGILSFVFPLWYDDNELPVYFQSDLAFSILFGFSAILSILAIYSYKKRQQQFVVGRLNILLNLILLVLFILYAPKLSGDPMVSEKGIGLILPLISIVFLALANFAVKRDEKLVKSAGRLRK
jgi:membrane protein CcdC involved in cytochrome C biogenesis